MIVPRLHRRSRRGITIFSARSTLGVLSVLVYIGQLLLVFCSCATEAANTARTTTATNAPRGETTRDVPAAAPGTGAAVSSRQEPVAVASSTVSERRAVGSGDLRSPTTTRDGRGGREEGGGGGGVEEGGGGGDAGAGTGADLGLVPCSLHPAPPGCFVLRTPFPQDAAFNPGAACKLRAPPNVTLDDVPVPVLRYDFDGADATFQVDIRTAVVAAEAKATAAAAAAGRRRASSLVLNLEARAQLSCPKETFDDTVEALQIHQLPSPGAEIGEEGRVPWTWIFPFNFFLVEEFAFLADSIEALVEAGDNLQITVTGDDGAEEFLLGGFAYPLGDTREGDDDAAEEEDGAGAAAVDPTTLFATTWQSLLPDWMQATDEEEDEEEDEAMLEEIDVEEEMNNLLGNFTRPNFQMNFQGLWDEDLNVSF